jgi:spectinomycin phosphotransferase
MEFEPLLDRSALMETIHKAYGYPLSTLTFLPEGEVGCHYIAGSEDGRRWFLTLLIGSRLARLQGERIDFTLSLTRHLLDRQLFRSLAAPHYSVAGSLVCDFQGFPLIVYDYIEGGNLAGLQPYPTEISRELGRLVAQLHGLLPHLDIQVPYFEQFTVPFEVDFRLGLAEMERLDACSRPGQQMLRELLLPQQKALLVLLDQLHALGEAARSLHPPFVLVHTDLTPGNILRTSSGELVIVDWEGAMLAPAEHDLFIFADEGFSTLLAEYSRQASRSLLHPKLFAYYFYRRILEDLTDFLVKILHENTTDDQDQHDLKWLRWDCLAGLPFLENCEDWAARQLRSVACT